MPEKERKWRIALEREGLPVLALFISQPLTWSPSFAAVWFNCKHTLTVLVRITVPKSWRQSAHLVHCLYGNWRPLDNGGTLVLQLLLLLPLLLLQFISQHRSRFYRPSLLCRWQWVISTNETLCAWRLNCLLNGRLTLCCGKEMTIAITEAGTGKLYLVKFSFPVTDHFLVVVNLLLLFYITILYIVFSH